MSVLDEVLSPENFPPCDPLLGAARAELAALRAENGKLRAALAPPPNGGALDTLLSRLDEAAFRRAVAAISDADCDESIEWGKMVESARAEVGGLRARCEELERCVRASLGAYSALRALGAGKRLPGLARCEMEARAALRGEESR